MGCFATKVYNVDACKTDVENLRKKLKAVINAELSQIQEGEALSMAVKGFSGLVDPGTSYKEGTISHAMTCYLEDQDRIMEDRKRRLEIGLREVRIRLASSSVDTIETRGRQRDKQTASVL